MTLNIILIGFIVIATCLGLFIYYQRIEKRYEISIDDTDVEGMEYDLKFFTDLVESTMENTLMSSPSDQNLSRQELKRQQKKISILSDAITTASHGNKKAKRVVINYIKTIIVNPKFQLSPETINKVIPFDDPKKLKSKDKFFILLYLYNKKGDKLGLDRMFEEYELDQPIMVDGEEEYSVTKERIDLVYEDAVINKGSKILGTKVDLTFDEKLEYMATKIFQSIYGLSVVDPFYHDTKIDEIDVGASGIPQDVFVETVENDNITLPYSWESIWIVYHGLNVHLECCGFDSQEDLIRVVENVYTYDTPYVMSKNNGKIVSQMIDGSRVVCVRPPFADSYGFFLRKFDTAPAKKPTAIITDKNAIIPILMIKWIIKGEQTAAITGQQNTGKTTFLKMVIGFISNLYTIRIQELRFEMGLRSIFPRKQIFTFQETSTISSQEGLDLQKKTNGSVNIVGEVASAIQAVYVLQTAMVASLFALFTHHAKTTQDLVEALANNLLEIGIYKDKKDAVAIVASVINCDIHLTKKKKKRYLERITEIIPVRDAMYPSEQIIKNLNSDNFVKAFGMANKMSEEEFQKAKAMINVQETLARKDIEPYEKTIEDMYQSDMSQHGELQGDFNSKFMHIVSSVNNIFNSLDQRAYYKQVTNPQQYKIMELVKWYPEYDSKGTLIGGYYKLENVPSAQMRNNMCDKFTEEEEKRFYYDLAMMKKLSSDKPITDPDEIKEMEKWQMQLQEF